VGNTQGRQKELIGQPALSSRNGGPLTSGGSLGMFGFSRKKGKTMMMSRGQKRKSQTRGLIPWNGSQIVYWGGLVSGFLSQREGKRKV